MMRPCALTSGWAAAAAAGLCLAALLALGGCKQPDATAVEKAAAEAARNPKSAAAQLALGNAHFEAKAFNDAFAAFATAHRIAPQDAEPAFQLSRTDFELRDSDHGLKMARAALAADPKHAAAHEILGRHLMYVRKPEEALGEFEEAIRLDPKLLVARLNTVAAYSVLKRPKEAEQAAADAVRSAPNEASAHYTYADLLETVGNERLAEEHFRNAIRLDPKHKESLLRLAIMLTEDGRNLEEARGLATQAQDIEAGDGTPAAVSAWALYQLGKRIDALRELQACAEANPYNYKVLLLFSRALRAEGFERDGLRILGRALQVAPRVPLTPLESKRLKEAAQEAQKKGGKPIDATKVFDKAGKPETPPNEVGVSNKEPVPDEDEE